MQSIGKRVAWLLLAVMWCNEVPPLFSLQLLTKLTISAANKQPLVRNHLRSTYLNADQENYVHEVLYEKDPYADILNMGKPLPSEQARLVQRENSILRSPDEVVSRTQSLGTPQESLVSSSLIENEVDDVFHRKIRRILELQSGTPFAANHTVQDILQWRQEEKEKARWTLPPAVHDMVMAVYIDKTFSLAQYREHDSYAVREFQQWRSSRMRKTTKDPLPQMKKIMITNEWLWESPAVKQKKKSVRYDTKAPLESLPMPVVILDEIVDQTRTTANPSLGSVVKLARGLPSEQPPSNLQSPLLTASIAQWEKSATEMARLTEAAAKLKTDSKTVTGKEFKIDEVEMFVANRCPSGYFVVL